jgi:alpha-beta hydrolase superfamily lysophospholipase
MNASMPVLPAQISAADGTGLAMRWYPAPVATPRGTILIVHGLGEHSGRYEHVAAKLREWGWVAVGYDHRGHGRSEGKRGRLHHADDLVADLALVLDTVRPITPRPLVLLGHSLGGQVAALFVAEKVRPIDALILSSPALDPGLTRSRVLQLAIAHALASNLAVPSGLLPRYTSHDPESVRRYMTDPLVHGRVTAKLVRFIVEGGARVRAMAAGWTVPTLLMYAGDDKLVKAAGSDEFAAKAPPAVVHSQRFDGFYHEIFNEIEKERVFSVLRAWLDERFPVAAMSTSHPVAMSARPEA